ncbi:MAG: tRNA lysidine(34) synthetase TilS [Acidimicrobiales bacterium]
MSSLLGRLADRCDFPPEGESVTCAVSGGADSLALLALAVGAGCEVTAIHVDHGLRPESRLDADVVKEAAKRFGASFVAVRVEVGAGPNLEARARAARYGALGSAALTGHTADDLAETVLLNMIRGAGLDGLTGFDPARRPIRRLRRSETESLCHELGLVPIHDPSNDSTVHRRNRVRHELLPLLDDIAQRDVALVLARQADHLAADAALLDALVGPLDPTDAHALVSAPEPLARRAIRAWLRSGSEQHPPDAAAVARVLAVAAGDAVACEVGGGRSVRRSKGRLTLES